MIRLVRAAPLALQPVPFDRFESEVLDVYRSRRRKATRAKVAQVLGEFALACPTTADITEHAISVWIADHDERAVSTKRSLLSALRAACTIGAERGYLDSPFWGWSLNESLPEPDPDELDRPWLCLSREQVAAVLERARFDTTDRSFRAWRDAAVVHLAAYTGARASEILGAAKADVDIGTASFAVRSNPRRRLKARKAKRVLPLVDPLLDFMRAYLPRIESGWLVPQASGRGPWLHGGNGYKPVDYIRRLGERAGVQGLTIEAFRHTFSTLSEEWGFTEFQLQRWLGHSRPQTQRWYRRRVPGSLMRAAKLVAY